MNQKEQKIPNWETCHVSGHIVACDPGQNNLSWYPETYRRNELKTGMNLCAYEENLPQVTVKSIHDDHIVVASLGVRKELYPGDHFYTPRKGLSYAYSDATIWIERPARSIKLELEDTDEDLTGRSKWWGAPDLPENIDYPCDGNGEPLMFVAQIRCEEIAEHDVQFMLPKTGMLYFFADIDEYMRDFAEHTDAHNGLGEWPEDKFRVIYVKDTENLTPCPRLYSDNEPAYLPARAVRFSIADVKCDSYKMLGQPYYDEIEQEIPDNICLLQIDESEEFGLTLYDCGMMCFMMDRKDINQRKWDKARFYFHSF